MILSSSSHSARVCGLKRVDYETFAESNRSHSARVCGLKPFGTRVRARTPLCHTPRECVDWNGFAYAGFLHGGVTLRASVWIETILSATMTTPQSESHSARVCGLKHAQRWRCSNVLAVTLRASVWIETTCVDATFAVVPGHTPRECVDWNTPCITRLLPCGGHTPRECVDWNFIESARYSARIVTLRASVWIET